MNVTDAVRSQIVGLGQAVVEAGLVVAAGGNIAARLDERLLLVTPTGWNLRDVPPDHLAQVSLDGLHVAGAHAATSELPMHLAAFRARSDVVWSVHLHPPMATLLHAAGVPIRAITTDHAFYLRSMTALPFLPPGSAEAADATARALAAGADVVLLRHHGCLVVAETPQLALSRAVNLEAAATATYRARLLGDETTACPAAYLDGVLADEARGRRYGARPAPP
jgi:L-fuculose-phosphate aldolase